MRPLRRMVGPHRESANQESDCNKSQTRPTKTVPSMRILSPPRLRWDKKNEVPHFSRVLCARSEDCDVTIPRQLKSASVSGTTLNLPCRASGDSANNSFAFAPSERHGRSVSPAHFNLHLRIPHIRRSTDTTVAVPTALFSSPVGKSPAAHPASSPADSSTPPDSTHHPPSSSSPAANLQTNKSTVNYSVNNPYMSPTDQSISSRPSRLFSASFAVKVLIYPREQPLRRAAMGRADEQESRVSLMDGQTKSGGPCPSVLFSFFLCGLTTAVTARPASEPRPDPSSDRHTPSTAPAAASA